MTINRKTLNQRLGMTEAEMDAAAEGYERDEWDSTHLGKVQRGRPSLFGEAMRSVSFKEYEPTIAKMDQRAASLSMSRSDYIRGLIDRDLALA